MILARVGYTILEYPKLLLKKKKKKPTQKQLDNKLLCGERKRGSRNIAEIVTEIIKL